MSAVSHVRAEAAEVSPEEAAETAASVEMARVILLHDCPYYAHIAHSLRLRVSRAVPTAAVSKDLRLFINPDYWASLAGQGERAAVLAHEVHHVLHAHIERREARAPVPWGIASDLEINDDLELDGWHLPGNVLRAADFSLPPHRTMEWYYENLWENPRLLAGGDPGSGTEGEGDEGPGGEESPASGRCLLPGEDDGEGPSWADVEAMRDQTARDADDYAKTIGDVPGHIKRWVEKRLRPRVDWRLLLRRHLRRARTSIQAGGGDYTFRRPSRRAMGALRGEGFYLPAQVTPSMRTAVIIDTSGSIGEEDLARAVAEAGGICAMVSDETFVYAVDTEAHAMGRVRSEAEMRTLGLPGGGGTDMGEGLTLAEGDDPDLAVVITDGYTPWPEDPPPFPVIAGILDDGSLIPPEVPSWAVRTEIKVKEDA